MTEYYTPEEIAEKFKVKKRTVYFWVREGRLKAIRLGSLIRVPKEALEDFILESSKNPPK
jgi:excisionase family DNA binding protein